MRLLFLILPLTLLALSTTASPWARFWTTILGLFYVAKWLTWFRVVRMGMTSTPSRHLGYLLTWPGMNAARFLDQRLTVTRPASTEWLLAVAKLGLGALLIWGLLPRLPDAHPLLRGWIGVTGIGMLIFFGLFHLLSLTWRRLGVDAPPQWRWPILATSASDFWSKRWNLAFHRVSTIFVYRPMARRVGATGAMVAVFLGSGIAHEWVVSYPAGGGYGLPTLYFLLQAGLVAYERTAPGKRLVNAAGGLGGRLHTVLFTGVTAFLLFHPPFLNVVILPGLRALGAG